MWNSSWHLVEDHLDGLAEGEGLAGSVGSNDQDGRQPDRQGGGDGDDGLPLLRVQLRVEPFGPESCKIVL